MFFVLMVICFQAQSQYFQNTAIEVRNIEDVIIKNAWVGGLNNPQFSDVDLNNDGVIDLFIFDRTGNKVLTFLNGGAAGIVDYTYDPSFEKKFPPLTDWVLLRDYNCDGIDDIFTYTAFPGAGIKVFRAYYDVNNRIAFTLAKNLLTYPSNGFDLNLYVSSVDIPALADANGDGDVDVITFHSTGGYVIYFENQSKEKGYGCDSLIFAKKDDCWGDFYEPSLCMMDSLNINCPFFLPEEQNELKKPDGRHAGSTELAWDNDGDGDLEFLKGDVSCNNLVYMVNGGTPTNAIMISEDVTFPSYDKPADVFIYPAPFLEDVNNDGLADLLAAPNANGGVENYRCAWFWKNAGNAIVANFNFVTDSFLVDEMIDLGEGAYPVFFDADADGLKDLLIGNRGYFNSANINLYDGRLILFKNTGTLNEPKFKLVTKDYASLSLLNIKTVAPTFGDIDGDGDEDMISGTEDGVLLFFKNIAPLNTPANFVFFGTNYGGIDVGNFSLPQLIDVNRDGLLDLLIGESSGNINYYQNTGSVSNAAFILQTTSFGGVKVNEAGYLTGYSAPFLFDENDGKGYQLLSGSERGTIFHYTNIDNNLSGTFALVDSFFSGIDVGNRSCVYGSDMNSDSKIDLVVGNYRGGVNFYDSKITGIAHSQQQIEMMASVFPNPATDRIHVEILNNSTRNSWSVVVVSIIGVVIIEQPELFEKSVTIDTEALPEGVYLLQIKNKSLTTVRKIVINR